MKTARHPHLRSQGGVMLLEALVAILIFSLGVLAIVQLQAVSIKQASGAEYRSLAVTLANDIISQMWTSTKTTTALNTNFASSGSGANYTAWRSSVIASGLPNVSTTTNVPTVAFVSTTTASGNVINQATVTLYWQAPGDTSQHNYVATAQLPQ